MEVSSRFTPLYRTPGPTERRMCGPHGLCGRLGEQYDLPQLPELEPRCPSCSLVTTLTELPRLL